MIEINKIPAHWKVKKLRAVCLELQSGKRPKGGVQGIETGIPSIGGEHLNSNGGFKFEKIKFVPKEFAAHMQKGIIQKNDIIIVKDGATTGKTSFVGTDFPYSYAVINEHVFIVRLKEEVLPKFVFYKLFSSAGHREILDDYRGAAQGGISSGFIDKVIIPIPPLPEQQLIVSKIEELLSDLDNGKQQLLIAQQQLKVYRQSLLKWLYDKSFGSVPVKLIDVCDFITKGTTPSKDKLFSTKGDVPFLKVYNLTFNGTIDFSKDPTFVDHETHNVFLKRSIVYPNDVLMNIVGPPLGKVSIVPSTFSEWNINQAMVRFRCKEKLFNKYLLYFLLCENTIRTYSRKAKATAGQFNLTLEICRDIEIPLPSIKEQQLIIDVLESKLTICDKIEETISQSLLQAETLRQSILKQAFKGKLV